MCVFVSFPLFFLRLLAICDSSLTICSTFGRLCILWAFRRWCLLQSYLLARQQSANISTHSVWYDAHKPPFHRIVKCKNMNSSELQHLIFAHNHTEIELDQLVSWKNLNYADFSIKCSQCNLCKIEYLSNIPVRLSNRVIYYIDTYVCSCRTFKHSSGISSINFNLVINNIFL